MRFLLDINVLVALLDSYHVHHVSAKRWFLATGSKAWATCPIVQNGAIRILGASNYLSGPGDCAAVAANLGAWCALPAHEFWADAITMLDDARFDLELLGSAKQSTDIYLLALAASKGGQLATFDRRIPVDAVVDGAAALCVIDHEMDVNGAPPFQ